MKQPHPILFDLFKFAMGVAHGFFNKSHYLPLFITSFHFYIYLNSGFCFVAIK